MPLKFAANLSLLWTELPYLDRFAAAADAGFDAVEVLFPYDVAAKETQRALLANGQCMVLMNAPPPNYTGGPRGFAAEPDQIERFKYDMKRSFRYCDALKVPFLHVMSGYAAGDAAKETFISNLKWAAAEAPKGLTLMIEPLNATAQPNYFLNSYDLAAELLEAVDAPNVALQYDSYHAQVIHGDALQVWETYKPLVRHAQIGDAPDRTPPGTGEVDFVALFARIEASGYDGWISAEYHPGGLTEDTLAWMPAAND